MVLCRFLDFFFFPDFLIELDALGALLDRVVLELPNLLVDARFLVLALDLSEDRCFGELAPLLFLDFLAFARFEFVECAFAGNVAVDVPPSTSAKGLVSVLGDCG